MTDGMKWFTICIVAMLVFFALVAFAVAGGSNQNCGQAGIYRLVHSKDDWGLKDVTVICKNGKVLSP